MSTKIEVVYLRSGTTRVVEVAGVVPTTKASAHQAGTVASPIVTPRHAARMPRDQRNRSSYCNKQRHASS